MRRHKRPSIAQRRKDFDTYYYDIQPRNDWPKDQECIYLVHFVLVKKDQIYSGKEPYWVGIDPYYSGRYGIKDPLDMADRIKTNNLPKRSAPLDLDANHMEFAIDRPCFVLAWISGSVNFEQNRAAVKMKNLPDLYYANLQHISANNNIPSSTAGQNCQIVYFSAKPVGNEDMECHPFNMVVTDGTRSFLVAPVDPDIKNDGRPHD